MNKKILIIGQKGLIGSNLFKYFKTKKIEVYSLSFESFIKTKIKILISMILLLTAHLIKNLLKINIKLETIMI